MHKLIALSAVSMLIISVGFGYEQGSSRKKDDLLDGERWQFVEKESQRDPFTFVLVPGEDKKPAPKPRPVDSSARIVKDARDACQRAEREFKDGDFKAAVKSCDSGLKMVKRLDHESFVLERDDVRERLLRLREAAKRLQERKLAEQDFRQLKLKVTGVVYRKAGKSMAIVNRKLVEEGARIWDSAKEESVTVEEILPGRLIMRFRKHKMQLKISMR
jgi:hypothetical protein